MFLSVVFNFDATVPGLGLKIKEKEFINLIFLINFNVALKSLSLSLGYPIIKSLENSISGFIFFNFS